MARRSRRSSGAEPFLGPQQRRELSGVAAIGLGLVLLVVVTIPGAGTVAGPLRSWLLGFVGVGSWLFAVGLVILGFRRCREDDERGGGMISATGVVLSVVATLGVLGFVAAPLAGSVGRQVAALAGNRLGPLAGVVALVTLTCFGLVLAGHLRVSAVLQSIALWRETRSAEQTEKRAGARSEEPIDDGVDEDEYEEDDDEEDDDEEPIEEITGRRIAPGVMSESVPLLPLVDVIPDEPEEEEDEGAEEEIDDESDLEEDEGDEGEEGDEDEDDEEAEVWVLPSLDLLDAVAGKRERLAQEVRATGVTIIDTLEAFGIEAAVVGANSGPTVTQYELQPAKGVAVRKILAYQNDLSLALAAPIRIQPFIPGKPVIGIEVPNKLAQLVTLRSVAQAPTFDDMRVHLPVVLGADVSGHPVIGDLTKMPHLLIAGATGSGKSVCINAVLSGFLMRATPDELKLILIDPKRVELSNFADEPHLLVPVVVVPEAAVASLRWAVKEMEERYKLFASHACRNIAAFNDKAPKLGLEPLPYIVIVIDELADLMIVAAGEIEDLICRIAQLARAVGIHLIVATQRPSADIITGLIKANIPSRVAFAVSSGVDSRVVLDEMGAEKLLGRGDMLYLPIDEGKARRLQGAFVSDRELTAIIEHWKEQGKPDYQEEIFQVEPTVTWAKDATKRDALFARAAHTVAAEGRASASLLQRKLSIGYTRAARLVDQLAEHHIVGPYEGSKSREILMDIFEVDTLLGELHEE